MIDNDLLGFNKRLSALEDKLIKRRWTRWVERILYAFVLSMALWYCNTEHSRMYDLILEFNQILANEGLP